MAESFRGNDKPMLRTWNSESSDFHLLKRYENVRMFRSSCGSRRTAVRGALPTTPSSAAHDARSKKREDLKGQQAEEASSFSSQRESRGRLSKWAHGTSLLASASDIY